MLQFRADGLLLQSGEPACLVTGTNRRAITSQAPKPDQIQRILAEIAPPEALEQVKAGRHHTFSYIAPTGEVRVSVFAENGLLRLHVVAAGKEAAAEILLEEEVVAAQPVPEPEAVRTPKKTGTPVAKVTLAQVRAPRAGAPEIENLFQILVQERCSDLHLCSENPPLFRKDGDIVQIGSMGTLSAERVAALLHPILPPKLREKFEVSHDVDFAYEIPGVARFRCNYFWDRKGPGGVFRVIPVNIMTAEEMGLSKSILELCDIPKGLVLVTGPTGSGKSTTLAAMVDYINRRRTAHLITIEDPIEFVHENKKCLVNQREVGVHTDGFKAALRAALREDPDIVLVGEMRDLETVSIAIETAETGHLVFGTLHTNTAASTVDRIIDQFPEAQQAQIRAMLSESLKGVVSQTLCKKKGGGRIAAQEVLIVTSSIANLIREGKTYQITSIMQTGKGVGMVTMNDALLDLVKRKLVEPEDAYSKAIARTEFRSALTKLGLAVRD